MDLDNHINLRSFVKPGAMPLVKAMIVAIAVHIVLVLNWSSHSQIKVAEIPNWVNVKLIAGIEETKTQNKIVENKPKKKVIKEKTTTKPAPVVKDKSNQQVEKQPASQTSTLVLADSKPYKLDNPKPVYPAAARRRGMQGTVLLSIKVSKEGFVDFINITKSSGFKVLDRSAVNSVSHWRFSPAREDNEHVASIVEIPIRFNLKEH